MKATCLHHFLPDEIVRRSAPIGHGQSFLSPNKSSCFFHLCVVWGRNTRKVDVYILCLLAYVGKQARYAAEENTRAYVFLLIELERRLLKPCPIHARLENYEKYDGKTDRKK